MLTVTDDAKSHLAEIMTEHEVPEGLAIRLVAGAEGVGLAPDEPRAQDDTWEHDGRTVLCVEPGLNRQLAGRTLSVESTEAGRQLSIA